MRAHQGAPEALLAEAAHGKTWRLCEPFSGDSTEALTRASTGAYTGGSSGASIGTSSI